MRTWASIWLAVVGAGALLAGSGCSSPRGCDSDEDCFRDQTCASSVCVASSSESPDSTTGPGTADGSEREGDPDGNEGEGGPDGEPDTTTDPVCGGTGGTTYCVNNSADECTTNRGSRETFVLGCVPDEQGGDYTKVTRIDPRRHCMCENEDRKRDFYKLNVDMAQSGCEFEPGFVQVNLTANIQGCSTEEMQEIVFHYATNTKCPFKDRPDTDDQIWCERDPDAGTVTLHWKPSEEQLSQPIQGVNLHTPDPGLSFEYEIEAELVNLK